MELTDGMGTDAVTSAAAPPTGDGDRALDRTSRVDGR